MDLEQIASALEDVFDQAIVFHAFTDYMRDYEVVTYSVSDPKTGIPPAYERYLFKNCVVADVETAVTPQNWRKSLDDRLMDLEIGRDLEGFVWGVRWQCLYPGAQLVENSKRGMSWTESIGIEFHEVVIETNAHKITLVFADLEVSTADDGYRPFEVAGQDGLSQP